MESVLLKRKLPAILFLCFITATSLGLAQPSAESGGFPATMSGEPTMEGVLLSLLFFILAGSLPVCRFIVHTGDGRYLPLTLTALSTALFVFSFSGLGLALTGVFINWDSLALSSLFFIPFGICDYLEKTFPTNPLKSYLGSAKKAHFVFAVASIIIAAANIISGALLTKIFAALLVLTFFTIFRLLLLSIRTGIRGSEEILFGFIAVLFLSALPVLFQLFQLPQLLKFSGGWGIFFLLLTMLLPLRLPKKGLPEKPSFVLSGSDKPSSAEPANVEIASCLPPEKQSSAFAHEIKTPLGAGLLSATHMKKQVDELFDLFRSGELKKSDLEKHLQQYRELTDMIVSNFQTSTELVNGFRQELSGKSPQVKQSFSVEAHLRRVLASLMPKIQDNGHQIHFSCPPDLVIHSYPLYFLQIVTNLVINSLTHAFPAGQRGDLTLDVSVCGSTLELRFTDNGRGMEPELCQKIFEPYFSSHSTPDNSGLGLFIVHSLVTSRLSGTIDCESTPGQGTRFTIKLPIERSASQ